MAGAVPAGGATGYVLRKISAADYNFSWLPASGSSTPGGSDTQVQYNDVGDMAGAVRVTIDDDDLVLGVSATPVTPGSNKVKLFGKKLATRVFPAAMGPSGMDYVVQPSMWRQKTALWSPMGSSTTVPPIFGIAAPTALGTATARTVATTNLLTRTKRLAYLSSTTVGNFAGHYSAVAQYTTGNGSGLGGFFYACRFAFTDASAINTARAFVGVSSSIAAPTNVEPSTLTNCVGLAQLSTDNTQLYIAYGGSAAQTPIALGTNFPPMTAAGATNGILYDLTLFSPPSENGRVYYRVERVGTSYVAEGECNFLAAGVQTPANTTLLAHRAWRCNNDVIAAVAIDIVAFYIETDY